MIRSVTRKIAIITFLFFALPGNSFCQDIYTYLDNTAGIPTYTDPLLAAFSPLTAIGTGGTTPCTFGFSGITGFTGVSYSPSGPCIEVTMTATAGYTITATGFTAGLRNSPTGPVLARMAYSTDGSSWIDEGIDHVPLSAGCATSTSGTTLASWTSFSVTNPTLFFRIYPYAAPGAGGTIQIYGLDIIGNVHILCTNPTITATAGGPTCPGGPAALSASGAGAGGTYTWAPATALSAITGATVTASPTVTTTYTVTGTTAVGGCNDTASVTLVVNPAPVTFVSRTGSLSFCVGDSVILHAFAGSGYTYQWHNSGPPIPGATDMDYTALTSGNYSVTVTNSFGCVATSAPFTVFASPFPTITVSPSATAICQGSSTPLTASGAGGGATYAWTPAGGLSAATGSTVSASPLATTTYSVTGTNIIGCPGNATVTVTVNSAPPASITASGLTTFCAGGAVLLTAPVGWTYQWFTGSTAITGATNVLYTAAATGNYAVVVTGMGCSRTSAVTIVNVLPLPTAVVLPSGALSICAGNSLTLNATAGPGNTYQWYKGTTPIAGAVGTTYIATTSGSYYIYVTGTNGCYNVSPVATVTTVPVPGVLSAAGSKICAASGSLLSVFTGGATAGVRYQWQLNAANIAGATNSTYAPSASGAYSCIVDVVGSCIDTSAPIAITVVPRPAPSVTYSGNILKTTNTYVSYQWYLGTDALLGATSATYVPTAAGSYSVRVTEANGCSGVSSLYNIANVLVKQITESDVDIYPNPATSTVHITAPQALHAIITSMDGRVMIDQPDAKNIEVGDLSAGIYIISLYGDDHEHITVQKLVISH